MQIDFKKVFLSISVGGFLVIFFSCGKAEQHSPKADFNLVPQFSFGHEGEVLLGAPLHIATDDQNAIFISDQYNSKIYEFNPEGEFEQEIGREGRGPGEFTNQWSLATDNQWLYVQDTGSMRLVLFSMDSDSSRIINLNSAFTEFEVHQDTVYAFAPGNAFGEPSVLGEKLIKKYDFKGNPVNSFGNYITMQEDIPEGMSWPYIGIDKGVVHLVFQYFPIYRAYSTDGELLTEQDLSKLLASSSNESLPYSQSSYDSQNMTPEGPASRAMDLHENRIFICRHERSIVIDEYLFTEDNRLIYKTTYRYDEPGLYYVKDFVYFEPSNSFFILETKDKIPRVTAYRLNGNEVQK